MNNVFRNKRSAVALLSVIGASLWSPLGFACDADPYVGSICVMAATGNWYSGFGDGMYIPAAGQQLTISQHAALYAVIGNSFGGDGVTNFKVPDLRGKVIVGYDPGVTNQPVGSTGGASTVTLTTAQLPPHAFTITNMPVSLSSLTATTTLSNLSGTANLSNIVLSGPASGLVVNASTQSGLSSPSGNFLGKGNASGGFNYTTTTPDVTLNSKTIGGNLSLTVNSGTNAPVSISGDASTTVSGAGTASGMSNSVGNGQAIATMPPYLVMIYYIAVNGVFPTRD